MTQFNFPHGQSNTGNGPAANNVGSDKLRKAIERNRIRQAKREGRPIGKSPQQEFMFNNRTTPRSATQNTVGSSPRTSAPANPGVSSTANSRVSVATANTETTFVTPKRPQRNLKSNTLKYPVKKTSTSKRKKIQKKKVKNAWLIKGAWVLLAFIFLRLIFAERGVLDYFAMQDLIEHKLNLIEETKLENKAIVDEMDLIKNNGRYQKKIVREKLGFISGDEYLVIFSEDSAPESK